MFRIEFLPGDARDAGYLWRNGRIAFAGGDEPFRALIHDTGTRTTTNDIPCAGASEQDFDEDGPSEWQFSLEDVARFLQQLEQE